MVLADEEEAFLAAVEAAPHDDAPRLSYADWLDDQGEDNKASYIRSVVSLLHPPEDAKALADCLGTSTKLHVDWRRRVGARFEVHLDGPARWVFVSQLFQAILNLATHRPTPYWQSEEPVLLKTALTREDAEAFVQEFGPNLAHVGDPEEPALHLIVKPMTGPATLSLLP